MRVFPSIPLHATLFGALASCAFLATQSNPPGTHLPAFLPGTESFAINGNNAYQAVLVVRRDGRARLVPVQGAQVECWAEVGPASLRARLVSQGKTDAWGVSVLEGPAGEDFHWLITAPGFAPAYDVGAFARSQRGPIVLEPAPERLVRILDPMGRKLPGARVELVPGCPHSPASHFGITDVDGVVALGAVKEFVELWIEAPGVAPLGYDLPYGSTGGPIPELLTRPGRTATGLVVDSEGRPVTSAVVRELGFPRGPATVTDASGRFTIHGCTDNQPLGVFLPQPPFDNVPAAVLREFADGVPLFITLARGRTTTLADGEARHLVRVEVENGEDRTVLSCVRLSDGFTARVLTNRSWADFLELPAGRYRIKAGDGFCAREPATVEVTVPLSEDGPVRLAMGAPRPRISEGFELPIELGKLPLDVRIPGALWRKDWVGRPPASLPVPQDVPILGVVFTPRPMVFPVKVGIPFEHRGADKLLGPVTVRLRVLDAEGRPIAAMATMVNGGDEAYSDPEGRIILATRGQGEDFLDIHEPGFRARRFPIWLPQNPAVVDLGDIVLASVQGGGPTVRIRVLDGSGRRLESAWLRLFLDGVEQGRYVELEEPGIFLITPEGHESWPLPALVEGDGFLSMETVLTGAASQEIRFPTGSIEVRLRTPSGESQDGVVLLEGLLLKTEEGVARLSGVPDGSWPILVGAIGHQVAARVVEIKEGAAVRVDVGLEPR